MVFLGIQAPDFLKFMVQIILNLVSISNPFQYTLICMNRLYSIAFKRILANLKAQEITPANVESTLRENKVKSVGSFIYHRLARQELKNFVKTPCPVQNTGGEQNQAIIKASKSLRASFAVQEQKVCNRCPHRSSCPQYAKPGFENNINAVEDLLVFMQAMNDRGNLEHEVQMRVWTAGYKACDSIVAALEDLKQETPESLEYEKVRLQHSIKQEEARAIAKSAEGQFAAPTQDKEKPKKEKKKPQNTIKSLEEVQETLKPKKIKKTSAFQQDAFENDQFIDTEVKSKRRQKEKQRRFSKSEIPAPSNLDVRRKQPEIFQRRPNPQVYRQEPRQGKHPSNRKQNVNDRRQFSPDRRQYEQEQRPRSGKGQQFERNRAKNLYLERKNHKKSLDKVKEEEINFQKKFENSGKLYQKTKVLEDWHNEEIEEDRFRSARPSRSAQTPRRQNRVYTETKVQQKPRRQEEVPPRNPEPEPEVRRGRKIRK